MVIKTTEEDFWTDEDRMINEVINIIGRRTWKSELKSFFRNPIKFIWATIEDLKCRKLLREIKEIQASKYKGHVHYLPGSLEKE